MAGWPRSLTSRLLECALVLLACALVVRAASNLMAPVLPALVVLVIGVGLGTIILRGPRARG